MGEVFPGLPLEADLTYSLGLGYGLSKSVGHLMDKDLLYKHILLD
jgi:hypothetical protein